MKIGRRRLQLILLYLMVAVLYANFLIFSGFRLIDNDGLQVALRFVALLIGMLSLSLARTDALLALAAVAGVVIYLVNHNPLALNIAAIVILSRIFRPHDLRDISILLFRCALIGPALHLMLYLMGMAALDASEVGGRVRHSLGFSNPNLMAIVYFSLASSAIISWKFIDGKYVRLVVAFLMAVSAVLIMYSGSRALMISLSVLTFATIFFKFGIVSRFGRYLVMALPLMGAALTGYLLSQSGTELDFLLSYRPYFFSNYYSRASLGDVLVGWPLGVVDTIDNGYLILLGAVGAPIFILFMLWIVMRIKSVQASYLPFIAIMLILSVFESVLIRPEIPVTMLFIYFVAAQRRLCSNGGWLPVRGQAFSSAGGQRQ